MGGFAGEFDEGCWEVGRGGGVGESDLGVGDGRGEEEGREGEGVGGGEVCCYGYLWTGESFFLLLPYPLATYLPTYLPISNVIISTNITNFQISDIYRNPTSYLNGTTAPLDVQGYNRHCNATGGNCQTSSSPDSFLWFDALHPSEQTDRVIAREFVEVVKGTSRWASYW